MIHNQPDTTNTIKNNNVPVTKPYMGHYTSAEIGNLVNQGLLGGDMYKKNNEELKMTVDDPSKFY